MKALLRKDFYLSWKFFRTTFVILLGFFIIGTIVRTNSTDFFATYIVAFLTSLSTSLITIEEREKWNQFAKTLPVSPKVIVLEKYVFSMIMMGIGAILGAIILSLHHFSTPLIYFVEFITLFSMGMIICIFEIPLIYIFGADKYRFMQMIILIVVILSSMQFAQYIPSIIHVPYFPVLLIGALIASLVLSCFLSIQVYKSKEFG